MPPCRFVLSLTMAYTCIRLRMALRHPTPPGQECSKGKWPLTGVRRFFFCRVHHVGRMGTEIIAVDVFHLVVGV